MRGEGGIGGSIRARSVINRSVISRSVINGSVIGPSLTAPGADSCAEAFRRRR